MKKTLILFYSYANGNTRRIANMIKEELSCDYEEITPLLPYVGSYDEIVELGKKEVRSKKRRKINPLKHDVSSYERIIIGTPTWWYTFAPTIRDLLKSYDFSSKEIILFTTNGGYPGHVIEDFMKELPNSKILSSIQIEFDNEGGPNLVTDEEKIKSWIKQIKELEEY